LVRTIGRWSLTALMVNSIVGVSIFKLPADLARNLGGWSPLSCVAAGLGILVIAGCIAEVSSRYEETGGLYLYARDALGRFAGLLVAWMTWLTRIAAPAAAANLVWTYSAKFFHDWKAGRENFWFSSCWSGIWRFSTILA
jgi:amino acid transporter